MDFLSESDAAQRRVLWTVLAINFAFFVVEMTAGVLSGSMGLAADSLDMLADAAVYGLSLGVVGAAVSRKKRVAMWCGVLQIVLAVMGLSEVVRRVLGLEVMPEFGTMMWVSVLALAANAVCLWLLHRMNSSDAHMRASVIFSANDVIINVGVIAAGALVYLTKSNIPDLVVGVAIFLLVIRGAVKILRLSQ